MCTLDHNLMLALNFDGGAWCDSLFRAASGKLTWVPLYVLVIWLLWRRFGWRETLAAVVAMALTVVLADQACNFFKDNFSRLRPSHTPSLEGMLHYVGSYRGGLYGTVSAHAATCFSIAVFSACALRRRIYTILILLWALLVAYSRIYLGVHFPLDILYGAAMGSIFGWGAYAVWNRLKTRIKR